MPEGFQIYPPILGYLLLGRFCVHVPLHTLEVHGFVTGQGIDPDFLKASSHTIQALVSLESVIVISPTTSDGAPPAIPLPKTKKLKTSLTLGDQRDSKVSIIDINDIEVMGTMMETIL
ncbi:hypothetical protein EI94DRAFT_1702134 [Lactarius quietus]|nr:hypothetical protein EI94DRAFT_1702134 [Lactarius quietus]